MTRVLVVHHDRDVADIQGDELRRAGYEVDQCAGPIGGSCPILRGERCWQVDLADVLLYDVWAFGDGAAELINDLRDLHPDKPVVLTSPGIMLNWVEIEGRHRVTPVPWAATGGGLADAVENALKTAADRPATHPTSPPAREPQPPQPNLRPHW